MILIIGKKKRHVRNNLIKSNSGFWRKEKIHQKCAIMAKQKKNSKRSKYDSSDPSIILPFDSTILRLFPKTGEPGKKPPRSRAEQRTNKTDPCMTAGQGIEPRSLSQEASALIAALALFSKALLADKCKLIIIITTPYTQFINWHQEKLNILR